MCSEALSQQNERLGADARTMKTQLLPEPEGRRVDSGTGFFARQHRRRMFRSDLLSTISWASMAAAISLWLADGGAAGFATAAGSVTALGVLSGLAGMDLVLLMLLLAARLPVIDETVGHDRALDFHRRLGKPVLYLLVAHGILILVGYGLAEGLDPVTEAVALWLLVPDMWLAFISLILFLTVVVTSLVAVKRRFPYEFWYGIHLLTYAAVLASLPHQFSVSGLFAEGTWQRWYWLAICLATGAALAYYRIVQPIITTRRHQLTVSRVVPVAAGVMSIEMTGRRLDTMGGTGGRFFIWRFLARGQWWHAHPFSLSSEPLRVDASGHGILRITVRNLGSGSARLSALRPGTKVVIEGPYGNFSSTARSRDHVLMVGAGIGITPLRALLETTPFGRGNATVILRGHNEQELYLADEILELCRRREATLFHVTGPRSTANPDAWLPDHAVQAGFRLQDYAPYLSRADVYVCGPSGWASKVIADARSSGVGKEQLHFERFDW
jgi:predicted ferric reductase